MKKMALTIMLLTMCTKILGFGRELVLSYFYGTSGISDAYLISLTIPVTIFSLIGTGIVTGYIPVYSRIISERGHKYAEDFTNNIINFILFSCLIIIIIVQIFTPQLVKMFASGFEGEVLELSITFTRIFIFSILFYSITFIMNSYLQTNNNFIIPVLGSIPLNVVSIISIALSAKYNTYLISLGALFAALFQALLLLLFAYKKGYRYRFLFRIDDSNLKTMAILSIPIIIGISVNQINVLVDRTIASRLAVGGISALNYANRLNLFIQSIFVTSLATVMYPTISKMATENNIDGLKKSMLETIGIINILVLPVAVGTMIFSKPAVRLLFGRGAFDTNAIIMTSNALLFYSIGMVGFGLREILSRVFYSMQDTKRPMINAIIGMVLNITLNIILSRYLGIGGLALATSIAATFTTMLLFISLRKKIGPFGMKQISISFLKILFASLVMGGIAKVCFDYLTSTLSQNRALLIAIGIGAISYFVIIYFMKIEDVDAVVGAIKRKLGKTAV